MAHWTHTNYKPATTTAARNRLLNGCCELKEIKEESDAEHEHHHDLLRGSEVAVHSSVLAGATGEADLNTRVTEVDPQKSKNASLDSKSFPIFRKKTDGVLPLKRELGGVSNGKDRKSEAGASSGDDSVSVYRTGSHLPSTSAHVLPRTETLVREYRLLSQGISQHAVEQNKFAASTSLWNGFVKSAPDIVPNGRDKGKSLVPPEVYQSNYNLESEEHFRSTKYHSYSSLLIREKKMSSLLNPQRFSFPSSIQGGVGHSPHDPIAGSGDGYCTADANIPNHTVPLESAIPQCFYGGSSLETQLPCSVHDVETMKIYTSIDLVEDSSRDHPKISQTTHHFMMSRKNDVNLSDKGQFSRVAPTKFKGNAGHEILDFSPPMSDHDLEGVKLEALGSSKKSEGKENVIDLNSPTCLKNESSAETDAMDIDALRQNYLPGNVPLLTTKCSKGSQNTPKSEDAITSAGDKNKGKSVYTALPDINQEPPEDLTLVSPVALASPVVDRETSTSRTHSLNVEHLLFHADEHTRSKSGNSSLGPDPSARWIKRLKLCSSSSSAHGTKSVTIGEISSREKVNNIFSKMKGSKTSSEQKMVCHAEEQMVPDLHETVSINGKSPFTDVDNTAEITLSHPWIRRWSHNHGVSSEKRDESAELREPKSSNTLEDFQKKHFPSIAAMAMMGKAVNCLNPSELTKKGAIIVWNTKGI
ncbi:hypothetical protein RIF29_32303 [Crotalaria pallida]|uniref:Uncharacterized protein n=1 Tax=Crotalaria pallida TaxID=3830 RepID=A0AAN9EIM1_CROPI